MSETFLYRYGTYTHDPGEITDFAWQIVPNVTGRGYRDTFVARATLTGRFLGCSWSILRDKIAAFLDAYSVDERAFGLFHPDGTLTRSFLDPADATLIVGPYVADLQFPTGIGAEYITKRDFKVVLEGIALSPVSQIIEYDESIRHVGTTGPSWAVQNTMSGPRSYAVWPWTTQMIVQTGRSTGLEGYYLPGSVVFPPLGTLGIPVLSMSHEHLDRREEVLGKPRRLGRRFLYYPASWRYIFEVNTQTLLQPV